MNKIKHLIGKRKISVINLNIVRLPVSLGWLGVIFGDDMWLTETANGWEAFSLYIFDSIFFKYVDFRSCLLFIRCSWSLFLNVGKAQFQLFISITDINYKFTSLLVKLKILFNWLKSYSVKKQEKLNPRKWEIQEVIVNFHWSIKFQFSIGLQWKVET